MPKLFMRDAPNDGGAACLATILHHFGLYITPIDLVAGAAISRSGVRTDRLLDKANRFGLKGTVAEIPVEKIHDSPTPFMAVVAGGDEDAVDQVVVVFRVRGEKMWIGDPDLGKYVTTRTRFADTFRGRIIDFEQTDRFVPGVRSRTYLARFTAFLAAWRGKLLLSLALGIVTSGAGFALIYLNKYFVDTVLPRETIDPLLIFLLVYFLARLLNLASGGMNLFYTVWLRNAVIGDLGTRFFRHLLYLEVTHVDDREEGEFIDLFSRIETLTKGIAEYFAHFLLAVLGILVKVILLITFYDPLLVAILCGVLALNGSVGLLFSNRTAELANRQGFVAGMANATLLDSLTDIRAVRIFGARQWIAQRFARLYDEGLSLILRLARLEVYGHTLADMFNTLTEAAIFIICGLRILEGTYTIGDFLVFFTFAQSLAAESRQFPQLLLSFPVQLRSFARVEALLALSTEREGGAAPIPADMEVVFDNVSFGYDRDRPVLKDVSFTLERGKTTAFVGASGSGKTTIMNLIMGFHVPDAGRILVNGRDLATLDLEDHRRAITCVFQNTALLSKSLYHNITLGNASLDRDQIHAKAVALGIDKLIDKLPMGYDLLIYQGMLSGGETQMVGILRALSKPFDLLIMDEATSHLDSETEARMIGGMRSLGIERKTRAIIAHRLNTVRSADRIVVMERGRIAEMGTHDELVRKKGAYMALVKRQYR